MTGNPDAIGQVALIAGASNPISYSICRLTGSHSGHMIIRETESTVISADGEWGVGRVRRRPITDFPYAIWSMFDLTPTQGAASAAYAAAQVGKPYAYLDDALIACERIGDFRFPQWVRARFADDGQWQCAELADACLNNAGVQAFKDGRRLGDVFPGSYEQLFIDHGWYTRAFFESFYLSWRPQPATTTTPQP